MSPEGLPAGADRHHCAIVAPRSIPRPFRKRPVTLPCPGAACPARRGPVDAVDTVRVWWMRVGSSSPTARPVWRSPGGRRRRCPADDQLACRDGEHQVRAGMRAVVRESLIDCLAAPADRRLSRRVVLAGPDMNRPEMLAQPRAACPRGQQHTPLAVAAQAGVGSSPWHRYWCAKSRSCPARELPGTGGASPSSSPPPVQ
jgi:hypothetical protein